MEEVVYDSLGELLGLVGAAVVSGVVTAAGVLIERAGLAELAAGHSTIGVWEVLVGGLALYVGLYLLGYHQVWRPLRETRADGA